MRDKVSSGRPRILDERSDRDIVRRLNDPHTSTAAAVGRALRSEGMRLSDDTVKRSLRKQGLEACVKTKKPLLIKKHRSRRL